MFHVYGSQEVASMCSWLLGGETPRKDAGDEQPSRAQRRRLSGVPAGLQAPPALPLLRTTCPASNLHPATPTVPSQSGVNSWLAAWGRLAEEQGCSVTAAPSNSCDSLLGCDSPLPLSSPPPAAPQLRCAAGALVPSAPPPPVQSIKGAAAAAPLLLAALKHLVAARAAVAQQAAERAAAAPKGATQLPLASNQSTTAQCIHAEVSSKRHTHAHPQQQAPTSTHNDKLVRPHRRQHQHQHLSLDAAACACPAIHHRSPKRKREASPKAPPPPAGAQLWKPIAIAAAAPAAADWCLAPQAPFTAGPDMPAWLLQLQLQDQQQACRHSLAQGCSNPGLVCGGGSCDAVFAASRTTSLAAPSPAQAPALPLPLPLLSLPTPAIYAGTRLVPAFPAAVVLAPAQPALSAALLAPGQPEDDLDWLNWDDLLPGDWELDEGDAELWALDSVLTAALPRVPSMLTFF